MSSARTIPAVTVKVIYEDVMVDQLCFEQARSALGTRRAAGKVTGYVEATLAANPGLAEKGPYLPLGTIVHLPLFTIESVISRIIRLWDDE